jgi:hypothetical protein
MPRILIEWGNGDRRWRAPKVVREQPEERSVISALRGDITAAVERSSNHQPQPEVEGSQIGHDPSAETRERAWRNIEETQERLITAIRTGDEGPDTDAKRFWLGGAIATFALLTGQDGDTLNRGLAEKYPLPTYQGMRVRDPHKTTRPSPHPGRQRPVDPDEDEVEAFGIEIAGDGVKSPE